MDHQTFKSAVPQLIIESVVPLSQKQLEEAAVSLKLDPQKITIVNQKTPSLIAGLRLSYQGQILDLSLQSKLNRLGEN